MKEHDNFYRDTWAEIDLDRITENIKALKDRLPVGVEIIAVVKANAYGHGDVQVAKAALEAGATLLAVAFLDEGLALREHGITAPILVLGASRPTDVQVAAENQISLAVFQKDWLQEARKFLANDSSLKLHLKLDSGMGRIGIRSKEELEAINQILQEDSRIKLEGVFTHFATADEINKDYYYQQYDRFREMLSWFTEQPKFIHTSNSAAALRFSEASFNAVRMGIAMYGMTPSKEMEPELPFPLKEVLSLHSRLVHVKQVKKGEKISYGATYEAEGDEWIGTVPIGYADGWIRKLQGQEVLVNGERVPIVGRICMDQCMVRLPYKLPVGTKVTLIGEQNGNKVSVDEIAARMGTINYEVTCILSVRIPRLYKRNGQIVKVINKL